MTMIEINTGPVRLAGDSYLKYRDWNASWGALNALHDSLGELYFAVNTSTRSLIDSTKDEIRQLQWDCMDPISNAMWQLGNTCITAADVFQEVENKWESHYESTSCQKLSDGAATLSGVYDEIKKALEDPLRVAIMSIAKNSGNAELEKIISDNLELILNNILDALPSLGLDVIACFFGGAGVGLLIADLTSVVFSTIVEVLPADEDLKGLYSTCGVALGYEKPTGKEDPFFCGYNVSTALDPYNIGELDYSSTKARVSTNTSIGQAVWSLDSSISSYEFNKGYDYQCFGQQTGSEDTVNTEKPMAQMQQGKKSRELAAEAERKSAATNDRMICH